MTERFWKKVGKRGPDECWEWQAKRNRDGYGVFGVPRPGHRNMRIVLAHRLSYEMEHGSIPEGMYVLHSCDNPACVNPAHLSAGTQAQNMRDAYARGRHCQKGEANNFARLTVDDVVAIRRSYAEGRGSQSQIARLYGVTQVCVSHIVNRQTWAHV